MHFVGALIKRYLGVVKFTLCFVTTLCCLAGLLACSSKVAQAAADAAPPIEQSSSNEDAEAPIITTLIFEERPGVDTLSLKQVISTPGYLKSNKQGLTAKTTGKDYFRIELLNAEGTPLAVFEKPSSLHEILEAPSEDGSLSSFPVEHEVGALIVRFTDLPAVAVEISRFSENGQLVVHQVLSLTANATPRD